MAVCSPKAERLIKKHIDEIDDSEFDSLFRDAINQGKYIEVRDTLIKAKVLCPVNDEGTIERYNKIYLEQLELSKMKGR